MSTPLDFSLRDDDELPAERYDLRAYGGYSLLPQEFDPRGQRLEAAFSAGAPDFWPQMIYSAYRTENTLSSYLQSREMSEKLLADVDPELIKQLEDRDTTILGQVQSKAPRMAALLSRPPGFDPLEHVPERHKRMASAYLEANSFEDLKLIERSLDERERHVQFLADNPVRGFVAGMATGVVDPITLMTGRLAFVNKFLAASTKATRFGFMQMSMVNIFDAAGGALAAEALLNLYDDARDPESAGYSMVSSMLFGAVIGPQLGRRIQSPIGKGGDGSGPGPAFKNRVVTRSDFKREWSDLTKRKYRARAQTHFASLDKALGEILGMLGADDSVEVPAAHFAKIDARIRALRQRMVQAKVDPDTIADFDLSAGNFRRHFAGLDTPVERAADELARVKRPKPDIVPPRDEAAVDPYLPHQVELPSEQRMAAAEADGGQSPPDSATQEMEAGKAYLRKLFPADEEAQAGGGGKPPGDGGEPPATRSGDGGDGGPPAEKGPREVEFDKLGQVRPHDLVDPNPNPVRWKDKTATELALAASGYLAEGLAFISPTMRILVNSRSHVARLLMLHLSETPLYTKGAMKGKAMPAAVETYAGLEERQLGTLFSRADDMYLKYRNRLASKTADPQGKASTRASILAYQVGDAAKALGEAVSEVRRGNGLSGFGLSKLVRPADGTLSRADFSELALRVSELDAMRRRKRYSIREDPNLQRVVDQIPEIRALADELNAYLEIYKSRFEMANFAVPPEWMPIAWRRDLISQEFDRFKTLLRNVIETNTEGRMSKEGLDALVERMANSILGEAPARERSRLQFSDEQGRVYTMSLPLDDPDLARFRERNFETVMQSFHRSGVTDLVFMEKFGTVDPRAFIEQIRADYQRHIDGLEQLAREKPEEAALLLKERKQFVDQREADIQDVRGVWEIIRHTYEPSHHSPELVKWSQRITRFNILRQGGGFVPASLSDMARPIMVHGLQRVFGPSLDMLRSKEMREIFRLIMRDAAEVGPAFEMSLDTRSTMMADIGDVYGRAQMFDRGLRSMTNKFFLLNLLSPWNQGWKQFSGTLSSIRMMDAFEAASRKALSDEDRVWLAQLGISEKRAVAMFQEWQKADAFAQSVGHGELTMNRNGRIYRIPDSDQWEPELGNLFKAALRKSIDDIIVTPKAGDRPLVAQTWYGRLMLQYKGFAFKATQSILIQGAQRRDAAVMNGMALSVFLGWMVYSYKSLEQGEDPFEQDFQTQLWNAIDRSGMLGLLADVNNLIEVGSSGNVGFAPLLGGEPNQRMRYRDPLSNVIGPSYGMFRDMIRVGSGTVRGDWDRHTVSAARRLTPFQNLFYVRWLLFDQMQDSLNEAVLNSPRRSAPLDEDELPSSNISANEQKIIDLVERGEGKFFVGKDKQGNRKSFFFTNEDIEKLRAGEKLNMREMR